MPRLRDRDAQRLAFPGPGNKVQSVQWVSLAGGLKHKLQRRQAALSSGNKEKKSAAEGDWEMILTGVQDWKGTTGPGLFSTLARYLTTRSVGRVRGKRLANRKSCHLDVIPARPPLPVSTLKCYLPTTHILVDI